MIIYKLLNFYIVFFTYIYISLNFKYIQIIICRMRYIKILFYLIINRISNVTSYVNEQKK